MEEIIKLKPVFVEKIWGGKKLKDIFNYDIPSNNTGECWAISALKGGDCEIENTEFKGKTLSWLYENHRNLFGNIDNPEFPLLVKILDAADNLSIQVHPDDKYAREVEKQPFGKTEAWYVLDCAEDSVIEIGHKAKSKDEVKDMILKEKWSELLNYRPVKKGDFFFIEAGTVHAICKNTLIYEIQQSSDLTYRLYDYDRVDRKTGEKRELHTEKSIDVIKVNRDNSEKQETNVEELMSTKRTKYIESKYFKTYKYDIAGAIEIKNEDSFALCTVIDGQGCIGNEELEKGDNFIIPTTYKKVQIEGNISIIVSTL